MADASKVLHTLSQQYFDAILNPVERIYIDMEMLQDMRLGALLSTVTVKEEIAYIYSQLPTYNKRLNLRTAEYFPALHKTDEELDEIIKKDPFKVAFIAPWSVIYNNFHAVLSFLLMNDKATSEKDHLLSLVFNCSDIDYPIELFDKFATTLKSMHGNLDIKMSHKKRYEGVPAFYGDFNMFFLYDHETFFNNEKILDVYTQRDAFISKIIYTLPLINDSLGLDPSEYPKALASTSATLNLFCDFFYMQGGIPTTTK